VSGIRRKKRPGGVYPSSEIESQIESTRDSILAGLADDLDTNRGLEEILNLYRLLRTHQQESISAVVYLKVLLLLQTWMSSMGLEYDLPPALETLALSRPTSDYLDKSGRHIEMLMQIRSRIRAIALDMKNEKDKQKECADLFVLSDTIRSFLHNDGYKVSDGIISTSSSEASSSSSCRSSRS
jgi:cysteinyl-tRNA synthetase